MLHRNRNYLKADISITFFIKLYFENSTHAPNIVSNFNKSECITTFNRQYFYITTHI